MKDSSCEMKGFLSFLVLWLASRKSMTGAEITTELEKRRGSKPSPGTVYPVLKELTRKGLIISNKKKAYTITKRGQKELDTELRIFFSTFNDLEDMKSCCK